MLVLYHSGCFARSALPSSLPANHAAGASSARTYKIKVKANGLLCATVHLQDLVVVASVVQEDGDKKSGGMHFGLTADCGGVCNKRGGDCTAWSRDMFECPHL